MHAKCWGVSRGQEDAMGRMLRTGVGGGGETGCYLHPLLLPLLTVDEALEAVMQVEVPP